jgi:PAS domain S-box-containing protein
VENVRDGLVVVDTSGEIAAVNPAMERMTGYTAAELIGKSCRILNCSGCKFIGGKDGKPWCELFNVGKAKSRECLLTNRDGRTVHVLKSGVAMYDNAGNPVGIVETLTDISETIIQKEEILYLRKNLFMDDGFFGILGESLPIRQLLELIVSVAQSQAPVLIRGKSGTGKELVARAIHESSPRKSSPFIKVNCAALNENLLESELFGHVKGAYTGADRDRVGRFEAAHGGTLFLDEIGDIPLSTQIKLLRVLEEMEIERVGDHTPIPVDVRIISATNKDLDDLIEKEQFREDFYFRINVFPYSVRL